MITSNKEKQSATEVDPVDFEILMGVLRASSDACWCMDFGTPVDLTAPDHEVVRQVFENDPIWRMSNPAMAQLYLLPADKQFNDQPVSDIFPRNTQNEEFVRNLIANGFEADRAPALDTRYDGVQIYVENDVRAHIENGQLIRMFGTVRDIGKHQRREYELLAERNACLEALNAVSAPVVSLDERGLIQLANESAISLIVPDQVDHVGKDIFSLVEAYADADFSKELKAEFDRIIAKSIPNEAKLNRSDPDQCWTLTVGGDQSAKSLILTVEALSQGGRHV